MIMQNLNELEHIQLATDHVAFIRLATANDWDIAFQPPGTGRSLAEVKAGRHIDNFQGVTASKNGEVLQVRFTNNTGMALGAFWTRNGEMLTAPRDVSTLPLFSTLAMILEGML